MNPGDANQRPSVSQDEAAQNDEEALALSAFAGGVEGGGTASISGDADKWTDADLLPTWEDAGLATPPEGYKVNRGAAYYPLEVTREDGVARIADFVKVKWSGNPLICGRFKDDPAVYFDYLHAIPVIQSQPIRTYTTNEVSFYKESHPLSEEVDDAVEWLGDVSLKAELTRWRHEDSRLSCMRWSSLTLRSGSCRWLTRERRVGLRGPSSMTVLRGLTVERWGTLLQNTSVDEGCRP